MNNPHESLKEWLNTIDNENLQDIAFLLSPSPYFSEVKEIAHKADEMLEKFLETIDRYSQPSHESAGFLITFKALFDFNFDSRSSEEGWNIVEKRCKRMLDHPDLTPNMRDHLIRMIDALPARKKTWIDLYKIWNDLKQNALSDNSIRIWEQSGFKIESLQQPLAID